MHLNATITLLKKMFKRIFILPALAVLFLTSCNSKGCYEKMDVKVYCSLYSLTLNKAVGIDSVSVWGAGSDSLVCDNDTVSELALELNPNLQKTQYVIQATQNGHIFTDTLSFYHKNKPWFESMECGCMVFSTLDSCKTTGTIFQSAVILDPDIINIKTKHVTLNI